MDREGWGETEGCQHLWKRTKRAEEAAAAREGESTPTQGSLGGSVTVLPGKWIFTHATSHPPQTVPGFQDFHPLHSTPDHRFRNQSSEVVIPGMCPLLHSCQF